MYEFSAPMPYSKEDIDKLLDINKEAHKSQITSLYACVPRGCEVFTGFEQSRNFAFGNTSWDYWKGLIEHTLEKGCDYIHLLNSPRPLPIDNPDFPKSLERLDLLLSELKKIGVNKLRVAAGQLMTYIGRHYPDFQVLASTSLEYKTIWEYQNFIHFHKEVKQIVPSHDVNKNFKLLSILRKKYPQMEIEIMVNEGCLQGCPNRMFHEYISIDGHAMINNDFCLSGGYATAFCNPVIQKYPIQSVVIGTHIFPWDIAEYAKLGITKFKLVGRDGYEHFDNYIKGYSMYLRGVDDIKNIENCYLTQFTHHLSSNPVLNSLTVKDYKKYLPDIKHFVKEGHLCASRCGAECRYCYNCAEKIEKVWKMKHEEEKKRTMPVCVITKPRGENFGQLAPQ